MAVTANPRRRERGFSLIELMFALAVIAIALFGILSMVLHGMAMREAARETEAAKEWVQKKLEEVKSQQFADLGKNGLYQPSGTSTVYSATFSGSATPAQLPSAAGVLTVDYGNANLCEIIAKIDWKGRLGKGSYSMRSLYAK